MTENIAAPELVRFVARIVAARNTPVDQIADLVTTLYQTLNGLHNGTGPRSTPALEGPKAGPNAGPNRDNAAVNRIASRKSPALDRMVRTEPAPIPARKAVFRLTPAGAESPPAAPAYAEPSCAEPGSLESSRPEQPYESPPRQTRPETPAAAPSPEIVPPVPRIILPRRRGRPPRNAGGHPSGRTDMQPPQENPPVPRILSGTMRSDAVDRPVPPAAEEPLPVAGPPRLMRRSEVPAATPAFGDSAYNSQSTLRGIVKWFDPRSRRGALRLPGFSTEVSVDGGALERAGIARLFKGQEIEASVAIDQGQPTLIALSLPGRAAPNDQPFGGKHAVRRHAKPVVIELKRDALRRVAARVEAEQLLGVPGEAPSRRQQAK
jgi:cold shock CspA family protein